jgi:hypothetical protein
MNQDEASVKQENKNITPETWQTVEARTDIVNTVKTHHSANTVGLCHEKTSLNGFMLDSFLFLPFHYNKMKTITK